MMRRIRDILIFGLCLLLALAPAVEANSGPTQWEGVEGVGALVVDEDCTIVAEAEVLTFDVSQFPDEYYVSASELERYSASVTAEYTFRNPTEADVTATLLFPYGRMPQYAGSYADASAAGYGVWIDGAEVEVTHRASLHHDGTEFDMEEDLSRLHGNYMEHDFYRPEMTVTKYVYRVSGVDHEAYPAAYAAMDVHGETGRKIVAVDFNGGRSGDGFTRMGVFVDRSDSNVDTYVVYVIGEPFAEQPRWAVYEDGGCEAEIEGAMELEQTSVLTFRELALMQYDGQYGIPEADWYNAFVQDLDRNEWSDGCIGPDLQWNMVRCTMRWFQYELTVPAGGTVVNRVTAPLYPAIHTAWEPPIYTYTYLLSPAQGWAEFGTLDILINTPFHMTQCNLEGFEETEEGYELHLEGLPDRELEFVLSESRNPAKPGTTGTRNLLLAAGGVALVVGFLIRRRKRK